MSRTSTQPSAGLTAKIINPLLSSVVETFDTMLSSEVTRGDVQLCEDNRRVYEVSALIGMTGRAKGLICISFDNETALGIYERFLGEPAKGITPDVIDALAEMANMIGGVAKCKLDMGLNIGLPNVVHGRDYAVDFPQAARPMRLHFDSDLGPFCVEFGFVVTRI